MKFLIQRVNQAKVTVAGETIGKIGKGLLVFVGIAGSDTMEEDTSREENISKEEDISMEENFFREEKISMEGCTLKTEHIQKGNISEARDSIGKHSKKIADKMTKKLINLRIFEDENGKTNLDLKSVGGELLIISQFTLYADCHKGNRPSFTNAGKPEAANALYRYIIDCCKKEIERVEEGSFGAEMKVELINDGPFTVILDSDEIVR